MGQIYINKVFAAIPKSIARGARSLHVTGGDSSQVLLQCRRQTIEMQYKDW